MIRPRRQAEAMWRGLIAYAAFLALVGVVTILGTSPNQPRGWAPGPAATAFTVFRLVMVLASLASVPITMLKGGGARFVGLVIIVTTAWLFLVFLGVDWRLGWPLRPLELAVWYFLKPLGWLVSTIPRPRF